MDLNEGIDMKKQLSIISFSHEVDHPELKEEFWDGFDIEDINEADMLAAMDNATNSLGVAK